MICFLCTHHTERTSRLRCCLTEICITSKWSCCKFDSHTGCWGTSTGISHKSRSNPIQRLGYCWSGEIWWSARWILHPR